MDLIKYLNEKKIIKGSAKPPYDFDTIKKIAFAAIDLEQGLKYKYLRKEHLGEDIVDSIRTQFMCLELSSLDYENVKFRDYYNSFRKLLKDRQYDKILEACKEWLLFDHRDSGGWEGYSWVQFELGNYIESAKAAELVEWIDSCMADISLIMQSYFNAGEYERLLLAHEVYSNQPGGYIRNYLNYTEESVKEIMDIVEQARKKLAKKD